MEGPYWYRGEVSGTSKDTVGEKKICLASCPLGIFKSTIRAGAPCSVIDSTSLAPSSREELLGYMVIKNPKLALGYDTRVHV